MELAPEERYTGSHNSFSFGSGRLRTARAIASSTVAPDPVQADSYNVTLMR
jgi:hypothetical protein